MNNKYMNKQTNTINVCNNDYYRESFPGWAHHKGLTAEGVSGQQVLLWGGATWIETEWQEEGNHVKIREFQGRATPSETAMSSQSGKQRRPVCWEHSEYRSEQ